MAEWNDLHAAFMALKFKIDGIQSLSFGQNISPDRAQGFTHAIRVAFNGETNLKAYATHPEHVAFVSMLPLDREGDRAPVAALDWFV